MRLSPHKLLILLLFVSIAVCGYGITPPKPYRAMAYSVLFPGGGQVYNHQYLKAGLVLGVQGALTGLAIYHDDKRDHYKQLSQLTSDIYMAELYQAKSNDYKDMLRSDIWWMGITMALSVIDAYVDAHMLDYDREKERIHLKFDKDKLLLDLEF